VSAWAERRGRLGLTGSGGRRQGAATRMPVRSPAERRGFGSEGNANDDALCGHKAPNLRGSRSELRSCTKGWQTAWVAAPSMM